MYSDMQLGRGGEESKKFVGVASSFTGIFEHAPIMYALAVDGCVLRCGHGAGRHQFLQARTVVVNVLNLLFQDIASLLGQDWGCASCRPARPMHMQGSPVMLERKYGGCRTSWRSSKQHAGTVPVDRVQPFNLS